MVPHDTARVVNLTGGPDAYLARMDAFFDNGLHDIGDEPGFLTVYQANYAGRPDKTVDRVLSTLATFFNTSVTGLPGNDDVSSLPYYFYPTTPIEAAPVIVWCDGWIRCLRFIWVLSFGWFVLSLLEFSPY